MSEEIDTQEFVQRIRQLGEQQDQHDADKAKKLEEDLIQQRSERLARRAGAWSNLNLNPRSAVVPDFPFTDPMTRTREVNFPREDSAAAPLLRVFFTARAGPGHQHAHAHHEPLTRRGFGARGLAAAIDELPRAHDHDR